MSIPYKERKILEKEIAGSPQWHHIFAHLKQYMYPGIYGYPVRLVRQIENPNGIIDRNIRKALSEYNPIAFVAFWGVGDKADVDAHDRVGLRAFDGLYHLLQASYSPGMEIAIIIADTHGEFNHYRNPSYIASVESHLNERSWTRVIRLSALYEKFNLRVPEPEDIDPNVLFFLKNNGEIHGQLMKQAGKHYGGLFRDDAHVLYTQMRLQEKDLLRQEFGDRILLVHGSKENSGALLPEDMGKFYLTLEPHWFKK